MSSNRRMNNGKGPRRSSAPTKGQMSLECVLGSTTESNASFCISQESICYTSGCVVTIENIISGQQKFLNTSSSLKSVAALASTADGKFIALGEQGKDPSISIYSVESGNKECELKLHRYGISCLAFSPNSQYVVSVGSEHDGIIAVWDWKNRTASPIISSKITSAINAIQFLNDEVFVIAGNQCVKFWTLNGVQETIEGMAKTKISLESKSAILGEYRQHNFVDLCAAEGLCHLLSNNGMLFSFDINRCMLRYVNVKVSNATSITSSGNILAVSGCEGKIRLFNAANLQYLASMPRPTHLGAAKSNAHPGVIACRLSESATLVALYADRSLVVFNISDPQTAHKLRSSSSHSGAVWHVANIPSCSSQSMPENCFVTCSEDHTIKFWSIEADQSNNGHPVNIMLYKSIDVASGTGSSSGIRCVAISPDGSLLASGDRQGNLRIHEISSGKLLSFKEAHDGEILSMDFCSTVDDDVLLATGSRDRLIHIFSCKDHSLLTTLDDHSASITCVKFANTGNSNDHGSVCLISSAADKSIVFRNVCMSSSAGSAIKVTRLANIVTSSCIFDFDFCGNVNPDGSFSSVICGGKDKKFYSFDLATGKTSTTLSNAQLGADIMRISTDNTGAFSASTGSDKIIRIHDVSTGELVLQAKGHSQLVSGVTFSASGEHLVSSGADGCIFVWKLSSSLVHGISKKRRMIQKMTGTSIEAKSSKDSKSEAHCTEQQESKSLPNNTSQKVTEDPFVASTLSFEGLFSAWGKSPERKEAPKGKWASSFFETDCDGPKDFSLFAGNESGYNQRFTIEPADREEILAAATEISESGQIDSEENEEDRSRTGEELNKSITNTSAAVDSENIATNKPFALEDADFMDAAFAFSSFADPAPVTGRMSLSSKFFLDADDDEKGVEDTHKLSNAENESIADTNDKACSVWDNQTESDHTADLSTNSTQPISMPEILVPGSTRVQTAEEIDRYCEVRSDPIVVSEAQEQGCRTPEAVPSIIGSKETTENVSFEGSSTVDKIAPQSEEIPSITERAVPEQETSSESQIANGGEENSELAKITQRLYKLGLIPKAKQGSKPVLKELKAENKVIPVSKPKSVNTAATQENQIPSNSTFTASATVTAAVAPAPAPVTINSEISLVCQSSDSTQPFDQIHILRNAFKCVKNVYITTDVASTKQSTAEIFQQLANELAEVGFKPQDKSVRNEPTKNVNEELASYVPILEALAHRLKTPLYD